MKPKILACPAPCKEVQFMVRCSHRSLHFSHRTCKLSKIYYDRGTVKHCSFCRVVSVEEAVLARLRGEKIFDIEDPLSSWPLKGTRVTTGNAFIDLAVMALTLCFMKRKGSG